eukprot:SAG31_NODE_1660_length_7599_cov_3.194800_6_plen_308_part_00
MWGILAPKQSSTSELSVVQLGQALYSLGGYPSDRVTTATVERYAAEDNEWTFVAPMPIPLNHAMAAEVLGKLYVIGGQQGDSGAGPYEQRVFVYDPAEDTWDEKSPMPTLRSAGDAAVVGERIFVAGGRSVETGSVFQVYDTVADEWSELRPVPQQRNHLVVDATLDGKVIAVAGRIGASFRDPQVVDVDIYDPITGDWTKARDMPASTHVPCCSGMNGAVVNGCLHIFGGENGDNVFPEHYSYDPYADEWTRWADIPVPVHGIQGVASIDGWIHLVGGGTSTGGSSGQKIHQAYYAGGLTCSPKYR